VYVIDWHNIKYQHCIYIVTESCLKSFGCSGRRDKLLHSHQIGPQSFELQRQRLTESQHTTRCPRRSIVMHNTIERGCAMYWIVCRLHCTIITHLPSVCRAVKCLHHIYSSWLGCNPHEFQVSKIIFSGQMAWRNG